MGGDEFLILLPQLTAEGEAADIAEALLTAVCEGVVIEGRAVHLAASVGIGLCPITACESEALVRCADDALYRVKAQGKNGYAIYQ